MINNKQKLKQPANIEQLQHSKTATKQKQQRKALQEKAMITTTIGILGFARHEDVYGPINMYLWMIFCSLGGVLLLVCHLQHIIAIIVVVVATE